MEGVSALSAVVVVVVVVDVYLFRYPRLDCQRRGYCFRYIRVEAWNWDSRFIGFNVESGCSRWIFPLFKWPKFANKV